MKRIGEWKYLTLLVSLLLVVVAFPILRAGIDTRVVLDVLISILFLTALLLVFPDRVTRAVGLVLGVPTLLGIWTGYFLPGLPQQTLSVVLHALSALFFALTVGVILRDVNRAREVSADTIYGAFCGYLLTGLLFSHLYSMVEIVQPGSFRSDALALAGDLAGDRRHYLLVYFSFVTLATVGYGDITPSGDTARGLAVVEAIVGQFYIAVLVAVLIGKRVSQGFRPVGDAAAPSPTASAQSKPSC
jgi:Ion channel